MHHIVARLHECVRGRGSADPGSTVSQAASRQAGLSHGPPGESCLLCARAVMIVPAGVGGLHMRSHIHPHIPHHTVLHIFMYIHVCAHTAYSCINAHTHTFAAIQIAVLVLHVFAACTHFKTYCTCTQAQMHTFKVSDFGVNCPFKTFSTNFKGTEYSPEAVTEVCTQTGMLQRRKGHLSAKCVCM